MAGRHRARRRDDHARYHRLCDGIRDSTPRTGAVAETWLFTDRARVGESRVSRSFRNLLQTMVWPGVDARDLIPPLSVGLCRFITRERPRIREHIGRLALCLRHRDSHTHSYYDGHSDAAHDAVVAEIRAGPLRFAKDLLTRYSAATAVCTTVAHTGTFW
jgi:hypothetical protein